MSYDGDHLERRAKVEARLVGYGILQRWVWIAAVTLIAVSVVFPPAWIPVAVLGGVLVAAPPTRRRILQRLHSDHVRTQITRALVRAGAADPPKKSSLQDRSYVGPRPRRARATPYGDRVELYAPNGYDRIDDALLHRAAAKLPGCRSLTLEPHETGEASRRYLLVERRDPFREMPPFPWPLKDHATASVWDPLPLAVDTSYEPIHVETMGGHVLLAGNTNSGKSVCLNLLVAQAALDPNADITLLDNQEVELGPWAASAARFVGASIPDAVAALERVRDLMEERTRQINANKAKKVDVGGPTIHVFIDEGAYYFNADNEPEDQQGCSRRFTSLLLDLVQRGRKAGVRVVLAMQRPSATLLNTDVRAQFTYGICFRTNDPQTTRMIFPGNTPPAHEIPATKKDGVPIYAGVGYLETDTAHVQRVRGYYLSDGDVQEIASRAAALRTDRDLATLLQPVPAGPVRDVWIPENAHEGEYHGEVSAGPEKAETAPLGSETPDLTDPAYVREQIRQVFAEHGPMTREQANNKLRRRAPHWHREFLRMMDDGLAAKTPRKTPGKPGPPTQYLSVRES